MAERERNGRELTDWDILKLQQYREPNNGDGTDYVDVDGATIPASQMDIAPDTPENSPRKKPSCRFADDSDEEVSVIKPNVLTRAKSTARMSMAPPPTPRINRTDKGNRRIMLEAMEAAEELKQTQGETKTKEFVPVKRNKQNCE